MVALGGGHDECSSRIIRWPARRAGEASAVAVGVARPERAWLAAIHARLSGVQPSVLTLKKSTCASSSTTAAPAWTWTCPTTASSARWRSAPRRRWPIPSRPSPACSASPIGTPPLAELASGRKNACILICDITRPVPNQLILPPMLRTLEEQGIPRDEILILDRHRPAPAQRGRRAGRDGRRRRSSRNYRIENHHGKVLDEHDYLGTTPNGVPVWIDSRYVQADLKITTGLIEPHLMAGYSRRPQGHLPRHRRPGDGQGLARPEVPRASEGRLRHLEGNPVHEENTRIAQMAGCDFIVNVCIDGQRRITWVGAGDMEQAWLEGRRASSRTSSACRCPSRSTWW